MSAVAAVDCGTNSIRLLIAEAGPNGGLVDRCRRTEIVRLGQGVDATGEFQPAALRRTFAVVAEYAAAISEAGVPTDGIRFVATSAARDVSNREEFFAGVEQRLGVRPEVISGREEARLSFAGALSGVRPTAEPVLVIDIGGGSTELITGSAAGTLDQAVSLDIGSVRLTERFLKTHPPAADDFARAAAYVEQQLSGCGIPLAEVGTMIGVAGTATTLAGVHLQLPRYDRDRVHGSTIPVERLHGLLQTLASATLDQIRALPSMHPQRADVVTGGALIADRIAARTPVAALLVSESDLLDGIALKLLSAPAAYPKTGRMPG